MTSFTHTLLLFYNLLFSFNVKIFFTGPPKVVLFRALTSTVNSLPERGEFIEGRVLGSERLSLLIDIGDGIKRRVSRTISVVLSKFNSTSASSTGCNDIGRRMALRSKPNLAPTNTKEPRETVKWEEAVVISYRSRSPPMTS